jgi:hypothetical protein
MVDRVIILFIRHQKLITTKEKTMATETLTKVIVDCSTGEQTIIPLTTEELAQLEVDRAAAAEAQAAAEAEATAAAEAKASGIAKLLALGLTEAEANALIK